MATQSKRIENLMAAINRLSRREKLMVAFLAVCFIIFITVLLSMWISSRLNAIERRISTRTAQLQTIADLRDQFEEANQAQKKSQDRIRRGSNVQLVSILESLDNKLGVGIDGMQPRSPTLNPELGIMENKVEVSIPKITIDRLVEFLDEIQRKSQTIVVRNLSIEKDFREPDQLNVKFVVSNFQLMEEKDGTAEHGAPTLK